MSDKNKTHYVVVTGILVKNGKYLITKRANWEKAFPGQWTVPGGKLEVLDYVLKKKDTGSHWYNVLENLLKREIKEETGLEIKNIGYVTSLVYIRPDEIPCLIISLYAEPEEGDVKLCDALTGHAWVSLEEARGFELIEGIYEELEILDKFLKKGENMDWKGSGNYNNI
jgi:8-oxo-dGTP pyrophosphatase MutT (NUDIX family)